MNQSEEDSWYRREVLAREAEVRALLRIAKSLEKIAESSYQPFTVKGVPRNEPDKQAQPA